MRTGNRRRAAGARAAAALAGMPGSARIDCASALASLSDTSVFRRWSQNACSEIDFGSAPTG